MNNKNLKVGLPISITVILVAAFSFFNQDNYVHYVSGYMTYIVLIGFILGLPSLLIPIETEMKNIARFFVYLLASLLSILFIFSLVSIMGSQEIGLVEEYSYKADISRIDKKKPVRNSSPSVCNFGAWWIDPKTNHYIYHCTTESIYNQWLNNPKSLKVEVKAKQVLWGYATKIEQYNMKSN